MRVLLAERIVLALLALPMIGVVHYAIGNTRGTNYLRPGLINARSGVRLPGMTTPLRWGVVGQLGAIFLAGLTGLMAFGSVPLTIDLTVALPLLGVAAIAAILNSFFEEVVFRAAPLSPLAPVIGANSAVLLLAVWFGLGHFYGGIPSGAMGALMAGLIALAFGRAMVATRGLAWPWAWHFSADLVIYASIALAATPATVS
jgi:membrane protease YdiL (CAAX protease family)